MESNEKFKALDLDTEFLHRIPQKKTIGLISYSVELTSIDSTEDFIAVGSNIGLVFLFHRKSSQLISVPSSVSYYLDFIFKTVSNVIIKPLLLNSKTVV